MEQKAQAFDHGLMVYTKLGTAVLSVYMLIALYGKYHYLLPWHIQ